MAAAGVRVVGALERFWIPVSNYEVTPVVAVAEHRPMLVASPDEVARIVEPPVAAFLPDAPFEMVERTIGGWPIRYGAYQVDGLSVWGATARILSPARGVAHPLTGSRLAGQEPSPRRTLALEVHGASRAELEGALQPPGDPVRDLDGPGRGAGLNDWPH